ARSSRVSLRGALGADPSARPSSGPGGRGRGPARALYRAGAGRARTGGGSRSRGGRRRGPRLPPPPPADPPPPPPRRPARPAHARGGRAGRGRGGARGGPFFGAALLPMLRGPGSLVPRSPPFRLLARGAMLFAVLAGARAVLLASAVVAGASRDGLSSLLSLEKDALFFLFRVLWGIVGPLALSYFIWTTADMRSNQAATGLLYLPLVFVLIGELLSSYLTVATGFPA